MRFLFDIECSMERPDEIVKLSYGVFVEIKNEQSLLDGELRSKYSVLLYIMIIIMFGNCHHPSKHRISMWLQFENPSQMVCGESRLPLANPVLQLCRDSQ